jgi:hypothetical protein
MKKIQTASGFSALAVTFIALVVLGSFPAVAASRDDLLAIAADSPVEGWTAVPDSTTYAQGDGLAEIYDGGYEVYTGAGVVDALRRLYIRGEEYIEVTVHAMKSSRSAREFLADRYRMETGKNAPTGSDWNRFTAIGMGGATAYAVEDRYLITVVAYSEGDKGKEQTALFVKSLVENARKLNK